MNIPKIFTIIPILFLTTFNTLKSQNIAADLSIGDTTQTHILETKKGDTFVGRTLAIENVDISFLFNNRDTLHFKLAELASLRVYDPTQPSKEETKAQEEARVEEDLFSELEPEEFEIPGTERVFLAPSAFSLKKNQWEYRNVEVFLNSLEYGINNHVSIGVDVFPTIGTNMFGAKLKASWDVNDKIHLGAGARLYYVSFFFGEEAAVFAYYHGSATFGSREKFFNFSYGLFNNDGATPSISIGGSLRVSEQWKLMADSFFGTFPDIEEFPNLVFLGASYFGHKHRLDFGLTILSIAGELIVPIPTIGYGLVF